MYGRRNFTAKKDNLLSQYSSNLGELMSRRRAEAALKAAKTESDMANRTKSEFLANMSHELRTPLNAIIGFADLMRHFSSEGHDMAKSAEYAAHIAGAGRHLLNIISDILDISKIESGTFTLNLEEHSLRELIDSSLILIRDRARTKGQVLEFKAAPDLPVLFVDGSRIKQVFINLLSNAHKFTGEGGRIVVLAQRSSDGGARVAIGDNGVGMSEEQVSIAMTPFGQIQSSYSRSHEGTGLGLPIAAALVRQHGGSFHISSHPGVGTTIVITLPPPPEPKRSTPDKPLKSAVSTNPQSGESK